LSQFTLWMGASLQITAIVTGALAVVLGGDVFWSLIGLLIGQLLGGGVMALHAAQGPKLGLPQMISSRVQFGVYGAAIPIVLVCLMYLGFTATGSAVRPGAGPVVRRQRQRRHLIFASVIVLVTVLGYRVIHWIGRVASVIGVIAFVYPVQPLMSQPTSARCCRSATSAGAVSCSRCRWRRPGRSPSALMWRTIRATCRATPPLKTFLAAGQVR
jgi:NCS1 family nucleobase:cation symporter-1